MSFDMIPKEVLDLVGDHITSVEQVTVLAALAADPKRQWTVAELARELRSTEPSIQSRIDDLSSAGILNLPLGQSKAIKYLPSSDKCDQSIQKLLDAFKAYPNRVIDLIYSKPASKLKAFSNAFRFRKDND
jgi:hypothetical protein